MNSTNQRLKFQIECLKEELLAAESRGDTIEVKRLKGKISTRQMFLDK